MFNKSFRIERTTDDGKEIVFEIRPLGLIVALLVGWFILRKIKQARQ